MSLSENELIYVMAYVDDQVDADELPEVLALLDRSEEARQIVAQHRALGDWVRETTDRTAAAAGADRIAAKVLAEIDALGGGRVIELERERARVALNRQRVREFGALLAVAAVAAAFWLVPAAPTDPVAVKAPVAPSPASASAHPAPETAQPPQPSQPDESAEVAAAPSASSTAIALGGGGAGAGVDPEGPGVDVQSVESPSHPFSIFYVPAATGLNAHSPSVVVWIAE